MNLVRLGSLMLIISTFKSLIALTLSEDRILGHDRRSNKIDLNKIKNLKYIDNLFDLIDKSGFPDGKITFKEWAAYFSQYDISKCIENEKYNSPSRKSRRPNSREHLNY
ncbi:hypothetical protein BpHYR1_001188 [Brachionus plicatilis]|uniref:EF-hand domain-containing protein n=1 Tax=Brachionus plicatilis TaxID=10195 RepID=A0A3M7PBB1_BRAPC|nr:hypothetical protein BpHYR1_001188 [Brachionus plicatilis]